MVAASRLEGLRVLALLVVARTAAAGVPEARHYRAGYLGELVTHPGVHAGVTAAVGEGERARLVLGATTGVWLHPGNHVGVMALPELGLQLTPPKGRPLTVLAGAGAFYRKIAAETVGFTDHGRVVAAFSLRFPQAWTLPGERLLLTTDFLLMWEYPYNNHALFHPALAIGLGWLGRRPDP